MKVRPHIPLCLTIMFNFMIFNAFIHMCVRAHTCVRVCALALAHIMKHYNVRKQLLEAILYSLYVGPRGQIEVVGPTH